MSERFHVTCPLTLGPVSLHGPEAHHLAVVCRLRAGDRVVLFNGDGREYPAEVLDVDKRSVTLDVLEIAAPERELPFPFTAALPLPKGDRAQFVVEKLTELGVQRLVPLQTARSVGHPREAKLDKLQRWVIEASKQCGRNVLMAIDPVTDWQAFCQRPELPVQRWLAHPDRQLPTVAEVETRWRADGLHGALLLAVGPEGGFTDAEVAVARAAGWQGVQLGPRILRIETAIISLCALASWLR